MKNLPIANKSLGQHWLTDRAALQAIADAAEVDRADTVLEIGPGIGTLTQVLADQAGEVFAVEFDEQLAKKLPLEVAADNLTVISQNILKFDFTTLPHPYKIVANIPYYLTSHLLRLLSESTNPPTTAALLVQKEVAERVAARPGAMSTISVTTQFYWQVTTGQVVPAALFSPPPKVDSQILVLRHRAVPLFDGVDDKLLFRVVKAGFCSRRKKLRSSLSAGLRIGKTEAAGLLLTAGISPDRRAQELSLEDWYHLYVNLSGSHIYT